MQTGADAKAGAAKRNMNRTTRSAFNPMAEFATKFAPRAMVFGRTAISFGTGIRAAELSQIGSEEEVAIPAFGPIDFKILKTHL
jgi:hypothetical protein